MNSTRLVRLSIILASFIFYSEQSWADLWHSDLTAELGTDYAVDPALLPGNSTGVWLDKFNPSYALTRTDGPDQLKAEAGLKVVKSSNLTQSANRTDPDASLNWLRQSNVGEFGIVAKYEQLATREIPDYASQLTIDSTRDTRTLSASWSKALSERNTLSANVADMGVNFTGGGTYTNFTSRSGTVKFAHGLSENVVPFLSTSYVEMELAGGGTSIHVISPMLGVNWKASEHLDSTLQVGQSREYGVSNGSALAYQDPQFAAEVDYKGEKTELTLKADHLTIPSGLGGFITANHDSGILTYNLSERNTAGFELKWIRDYTITNDGYGTMETWLKHDLDALWAVKTHYIHRLHERGDIGSASSNVLGVSLIYSRLEF